MDAAGNTNSPIVTGEVIGKQQMCQITIMFMAESDEMALKVKRQIGEIIAGIQSARVQLMLSTMNTPMNPPAQR